jgi:predicted alpha/beta hydrolase family esterase
MRLLVRTFALFGLLPYAGVVFLVATGAASWSSIAYVIALGVLLAGLVTLPDGTRTRTEARPRGLSRGAVLAIAGIAIVRSFVAGDGTKMRVAVCASQEGTLAGRTVNRIVDEGDVAVAGTRVLVASGMLNDDRAELPDAMTNAYKTMRREEGDVASPFAATYLGLERPGAFDLVLIEPDASNVAPLPSRSRTGVVFLHGFAGSFDLPCWQIARAVSSLDAVTACPSTRWVGDWWSPEGETTLRRTVDVLHARGIDRIVLVGLSNGGYGAAQLAPRMKGTFAGLVLISGAESDAPAAGIPTLVIHGRRDSMASFDDAQAYATKTGAKMVALDAGHFAMLVRAEVADRALKDFVGKTFGTLEARL